MGSEQNDKHTVSKNVASFPKDRPPKPSFPAWLPAHGGSTAGARGWAEDEAAFSRPKGSSGSPPCWEDINKAVLFIFTGRKSIQLFGLLQRFEAEINESKATYAY